MSASPLSRSASRPSVRRGSYVPAPFLKPGWWRRPKLLRESDLTRWLAGRVCIVSEDAVELDVADITPGARPVFGSLELPLETLASWWRGAGDLSTLEAGDFIEVGFYGEDDDVRALAVRHPRVRWPDTAPPSYLIGPRRDP